MATSAKKASIPARKKSASAASKAATTGKGTKAGQDWRDEMLDEVRALIASAAPDAVEERKWRKPSNPDGVPTWSQDGVLCTGERYKDKVKLTFAKGAKLADPKGLFNASLDGNARRAIDLAEGDRIDKTAFKSLIRAAVKANTDK